MILDFMFSVQVNFHNPNAPTLLQSALLTSSPRIYADLTVGVAFTLVHLVFAARKKLLGMEVWPPGGQAVVLLVVGGAPVSRVVSAPAEAATEPKVAVTEAGAGSEAHRPETEASSEADCPRGEAGTQGVVTAGAGAGDQYWL